MDTIRFFKDRSKAIHRTPASAGAGLQQVQHRVAIEAGYTSWSALLAASEPDRRLAALMVEFPLLNAFGIGSGSRGSLQERRDRHKQWRADLRGKSAQVEQLREWLVDTIEPRKTLNQNAGSYQLKHTAEMTLGRYVSNGELIAAALIAGYPHSGTRYAPNVTFGMREASIQAAREGANGAEVERDWR